MDPLKQPVPPWMKGAGGSQQVTKMPASLTQRAQQAPIQSTSQMISQLRGVTLLTAEGTDDEAAKLMLWTTDANKKTEFAPAVVERLTRAESMKKSAIRLIEAMRCTAQPNRRFRAERLVPSDVNATSERVEFARALSDFGACFDNMEPLLGYMREVVEIEAEIDQHQEVFLRQVMIYCVKPLKTFVELHHPAMMKTYGELEKVRDKYDAARKKDPAKGQEMRREFLARARDFAILLDQLPTQQMVFAKALDSFARAESAFAGMVNKLTGGIKQPDHRTRWTVPM